MSGHEWRSNAPPMVTTRSLHDEGAEVAPKGDRVPVVSPGYDDEEKRPPVRDSRPADGHLGGPDDDHYSVLRIQPIEVTEAWAATWPAGVGYHLGEAIAAIARCGTKGQAVRDLRKASWLISRAADVVERES